MNARPSRCRPDAPSGCCCWAWSCFVLGFFVANAVGNLSRRQMGFGFGYLGNTAGFDIPFKLIDFSPADTYGRALLVCVLNTLLVSAMGDRDGDPARAAGRHHAAVGQLARAQSGALATSS